MDAVPIPKDALSFDYRKDLWPVVLLHTILYDLDRRERMALLSDDNAAYLD